MKKKILFVLPYFELGGIFTSFRNLMPLLDKEKYEVDVFAITKTGEGLKIMPDGINVIGGIPNSVQTNKMANLRIKIIKHLKKVKKLMIILGYNPNEKIFQRMARPLSNKYDVVIAFQEGQATMMAKYIEAPMKIAWIHSIYSRYRSVLKNKAPIEVYENYNKIVCVSKTAAEDFIKSEPRWKSKVNVVYNAIDRDRVKEMSLEKVTLGSDINIVSIGRIVSLKRFSHIPRIASDLMENGFKFDWWIIGGSADEEEFQKIKENIRKYKVETCVHLTGALSNPYPYIKKSNLLVCLSTSETFNYTIAEAKVFGVPVVTTDFDSAYEFVEDGKTGLISPIENVAQNIIKILSSKKLQEQISNNIGQLPSNECLILGQFNQLVSC